MKQPYDPTKPETIPPEATIGKNGENTSADVVSAEEAMRIAEAAAKGTAPEPKADSADTVEITEEEINALKEKAEKSPDQLTDDEKSFLEELNGPAAGDDEAPPEEEKVYTVGGVEKKQSEILAELGEELGVDTAELPAESKEKMIAMFLDSKNKSAWQKTLTQKSQNVSEERKKAEAILNQVSVQRERTEAALEDIKSKVAKLEKFASSAITEAEAIDDPKKMREYIRKQDAEEELPALLEQQKELETKASQYADSQQVAEITLFQSANPQYQTSEKFTEVLQKFDENVIDESHPDVDRLLDIVDITRHAKAIGKSLEVAQKDLAKRGQLRVKATSQSKLSIPKPQPQKGETFAEKLARRQKNPTAFLPGKGGSAPLRSSAPKKALGDVLKDHSSASVGTSTDSNAPLAKMGYV